MEKRKIAHILEEIADLMEMTGENPFKSHAYRNAARSLLSSERSLKEMIRKGTLTDLEGIGESIAEKITTLAVKGRLPLYEQLKRKVPKGALELMRIQGLGPKRVMLLYKKLKIHSVDDLKRACQSGKVATLSGFGKKLQETLLQNIDHRERNQQRHLWWDAASIALPLLEGLKKQKGVKRAEIAGSLRRKLETVGDLDFLVASATPNPVMKWFTTHEGVESILASGETKSSVRLKGGIQADLRIVSEAEFGFALCYLTGSKEHNIELRKRALSRGWSLSEYGLSPLKSKKVPSFGKKGPNEEALYRSLGLSFIPPELRENKGEFKAAEKGTIPHLIEVGDIRGTLHNHTTASDGKSTLKEMVVSAERMGWSYIGISDHSKSSVQAHGLSEKELLEQIEEIRALNASHRHKIQILSGTECDILPDGSLDFSQSILKQLDFVIASVHSSLSQDEKTMTRRIIRAIEHPMTHILGHVTCRLLLEREPTKVNLAKVIDACIANHKIMELNGNPQRLDMDWRFWHAASEKGLMCCINTDAHHADHHSFIEAGVHVARKGWLTSETVINTFPLKHLMQHLRIFKR